LSTVDANLLPQLVVQYEPAAAAAWQNKPVEKIPVFLVTMAINTTVSSS
jgi:hypothetical protein